MLEIRAEHVCADLVEVYDVDDPVAEVRSRGGFSLHDCVREVWLQKQRLYALDDFLFIVYFTSYLVFERGVVDNTEMESYVQNVRTRTNEVVFTS